MDISKLIINVNTFTKYFSSNAATLKSLLGQLEKSINNVHDQLVSLSIINEAQLPLNVVEKHPCLKQRVTNCVSTLIDEEISEIERHMQLLEEITTNLNKHYRKIEHNMSKLNWEEVPQFHASALIEITRWSEKCSKYFHLILCNITSAVKMFHLDASLSSKWFKNTCDYSSETGNLIFDHPAVEMFSLVEKAIFNS
ncbi:uncharacterized protein LOC135838096 [Planococcus citri]|uniref:uncharacterized protein LOC135838096 n=1 Tax=Planococcus citri TaxID=170843 RepID=UPI0031F8AF58